MKSIECGALWRKQKDGKTYFTGNMNIFPFGQVNVVIFENNYKNSDNHPDYKILYTPVGGQDDKGVQPSGFGNSDYNF